MKLPPKKTWIPAAVALLLLLWIYGGDLLDALRTARADVAALVSPPNTGFAAGVVLFTLGAAAAFAYGMAQGRDATFRGYRLLPILAVLALCADLALLPSPGGPLPSSVQLEHDMQAFAFAAAEQAGAGQVPGEEALEAIAAALQPPPYLVHGARPPGYTLSMKTGCDGPSTDVAGAKAGTLLVCVAQGGKRAWVTAVALPAGQRFGSPQLFGARGMPFYKEILPAEAAPEDSPSGSDSGG